MSINRRFIRRGLAAILILCSFYWGIKVLEYADTMSIKYEKDGLSKTQIDEINIQEDSKRYVTGWNRTTDFVIKNTDLEHESSLTLVEVYGDMTTLIPTSLFMGTFVEKEDKKGCIISKGAAEELFRNAMALGCRVMVKDEEYVVKGILDSKEDMLFITAQEGIYSNLEFRYPEKQYPASNTKSELNVLGLPAYIGFTEGNLYAGAARLFMGFPFFIIWFFVMISVYCKMKKGSITKILFAAIGGMCLLILLKHSIVFSSDYIPTSVSDFAFWSNKWKEVSQQHSQLLFFQMWYKEKLLFDSLKLCLISSVGSCFLIK